MHGIVKPGSSEPSATVLLKQILALAAPTTLLAGLQVASMLLETWLAARQGTTALAGWAVVLPFAMLIQQMSAGAMGGGVHLGHRAGDRRRTDRRGLGTGAARARHRRHGGRALRHPARRLSDRSVFGDRRPRRGARRRRLCVVAFRRRGHSDMAHQHVCVGVARRRPASAGGGRACR